MDLYTYFTGWEFKSVKFSKTPPPPPRHKKKKEKSPSWTSDLAIPGSLIFSGSQSRSRYSSASCFHSRCLQYPRGRVAALWQRVFLEEGCRGKADAELSLISLLRCYVTTFVTERPAGKVCSSLTAPPVPHSPSFLPLLEASSAQSPGHLLRTCSRNQC